MKKLVLAAAVMMLVPFSAFALDTLDDEALSSLTAQEGVTITFDSVKITQQASDTAWYDSDGATGTTQALTDVDGDGDVDANDTIAFTAAGGRVYVDQSGSTETTLTGSLTIDVATAPVGGISVGGTTIPANTSFVRIGLPSVSQAASAKLMTISMDGDMTGLTNTANFAAPAAGVDALGTLIQNGGTSTVAGAVYIYAH